MYDIIIIGAGPAGLTSALYASRANKKVLLLEASVVGGKILNTPSIENYPGIENISGYEFSNNLYKQVINFGTEIKMEIVTRIEKDKTVITNKGSYKAKAIIIATGSSNKKLRIENEEKFIGKGISYCATCDGSFYKNKDVAVIGGGITAIEDALYLSNICNKVYLINKDNAFKDELNKENDISTKSNILLLKNTNITDIIGDQKVEQIEIKDSDNTIKRINVSGVFIAIGQKPSNKIFDNIVELDSNEYILSSDGVHTGIKGIYVAGDTRVKELRQLTTAVGDGATAAMTAIKEMEK